MMTPSRLFFQRVATRQQLSTFAVSSEFLNSGIVDKSLTVQDDRIQNVRYYISRAHPPESVPVFPITDALTEILASAEDRKQRRATRWEDNKEKRAAKGIVDNGPYRNQDETIELVVNLNLDPRLPGQALRGSLSLPHGTGKMVKVVVFTNEEKTITAAKEAGATVAGGTDLISSIANGEQPVDFDRALATPDMMSSLSKIARILGPRGLMPNDKVGTICTDETMADVVKKQSAGMIQYRTEKNGIVQAGIGKGSFTEEELQDNIKAFLNELQNVKPDSIGKKKKGSNKKGGGKKGSSSNKNAKYYLKAFLTATQGKSVNLDLRTVDPTSSYFMTQPPSS